MDARFIKGSGKFRKVISKEEFDVSITLMWLKIIDRSLSWDDTFKLTLTKSR